MAERQRKTWRDMTITMVVLAVVAVGVGWLFFGLRTTSAPNQVPTADVVGGFTQTGSALGFPAVVPRGVPADWRANSFSVTAPAGSGAPPAAARGGWVTPEGGFITLVESAGAQDQVQQAELGSAGAATGTIAAGGASWTAVPGRRSEAAWIRVSSGGTFRFLITGDATRAEFEALAMSVAGK